MAGVYIHIPFCKHKCNYCNFYSIASVKYREFIADALISEIKNRSNYLSGEVVNTIYFGGGTPSLLKVDEINKIIESVKKYLNVNENVEITLEANPDDLHLEKVNKIKNYTLVNRFSIGVQSFFDDDLQYLDRVHTGKEALAAIENVVKTGFDNITIDLIYGIPGLTVEKWIKNLEMFFSFDIPHLSAYSLTVEPKTVLDHQINKNRRAEIDEELSVKHFELLLKETSTHHFIHYEISNFAKEGFYSKHNSIYWLGDHYLGVGPSAHSFNGKSRQWNIASVKKYIESEKTEKIIIEKEVLTKDQLFNEYIMTSLRTSWGCDLEHIKNVFGKRYSDYFVKNISKYVNDKKVVNKGSKYMLTETGKLFADGIASDLFFGF
jgi:oxygen-independent coproporphyrinogen-3 oxidase